jgi:FkbM family methyltransferase
MKLRGRDASRRALRQLATLPLRMLGMEQRGCALDDLSSKMIVDIPVRGGALRFGTSSPLLYSRARDALEKEPDTNNWIDQFAPGDVLWDIGANMGVFSLYAGQRPGIRVLAFEPLADNYAVLCANILGNALSDRISAYCIAFAGSTELGVLNSTSRQVGSAMHQFGKSGEGSRYSNGGIKHVQGMIGFTIDEFVERFNPDFPTHLKLDVDGLEESILLGAPRTLTDSRLQSLMVELNLNDEGELERSKSLLSDAGLKCVRLGRQFCAAGERAMNHFFVRE